MADLLLATNLVPRPNIKTGGSGSSEAWLYKSYSGAATPCSVNTRDDWGTYLEGVHIDKTPKYAPIGEHDAGGTIYFSVAYKSAALRGPGLVFVALARAVGDPITPPNVVELTYEKVNTLQEGTGELEIPAGAGPLFLLVQTNLSDTVGLLEARASIEPITDDLGRFDGSNPDTEEIRYEWTGDPELSASQAWGIGQAPDPDPDPEPEPEPEPTAWGQLVAAHINRAGDTETEQLASQHAALVMEYVRGYTRGRGFTQHESGAESVTPGIKAVIIAATARLTANPEQVSYYQSGDYSERPAILAGWTLPELAVLNNYRKRWA